MLDRILLMLSPLRRRSGKPRGQRPDVAGPRSPQQPGTDQRPGQRVTNGGGTQGPHAFTVRRGSTGPAVRAVQDQVNFRNNRNGRTLTVDGNYGLKTQAAVRAFQQGVALDVRGFPVDGVVGPLTWQALVTETLAG
jgi:peptidoglycan hydrolase-like protein with peptidoglycan-binding domain